MEWAGGPFMFCHRSKQPVIGGQESTKQDFEKKSQNLLPQKVYTICWGSVLHSGSVVKQGIQIKSGPY